MIHNPVDPALMFDKPVNCKITCYITYLALTYCGLILGVTSLIGSRYNCRALHVYHPFLSQLNKLMMGVGRQAPPSPESGLIGRGMSLPSTDHITWIS